MEIRRTGLIPVVRVPSTQQAVYAVEGVIHVGVSIVEITLTIPNALRTIENLAKRYGNTVLIGAGTVLDRERCQSALLAGAEFIVSPVLNLEVIETTHQHGKICLPGALTPTEVLKAWQAGADVVKIFPCGLVGGPKYIRTIKGPFPEIPLVPTGGVNLDNIAEFFRAGVTAVGVGEPIFSRDALEHGNVDAISANARRFVEAVQSALLD